MNISATFTTASPTTWTDERTAELRRLWTLGWTGQQIGDQFGISRSAVLGRARKLDLERRAKFIPKPQRGPVTGERTSRAVIVPPPVHDASDPSLYVTFMNRGPRQCCWPIGEPNGADTVFCGAATPDHNAFTAYCGYHYAKGHVTRSGGTSRPWK